jgi:hypothetical protein
VGRGHVAERVGVRCDLSLDVLRRDHPGRLHTGELAGVLARLLVAVHDQADELEIRVADDPAERVRTGVAGTEVNHSIRHVRRPISEGW